MLLGGQLQESPVQVRLHAISLVVPQLSFTQHLTRPHTSADDPGLAGRMDNVYWDFSAAQLVRETSNLLANGAAYM